MDAWRPGERTHAAIGSQPAADSLAAIVVGVDRLRDVADALGPTAADAVLATTAARLEAGRTGEMMLAPLFGDAFALLAPGLCDRTAALALAHELHDFASQPIAIADHELAISVSVGVALGATVGVAAQGVLRDAAIAQHRAQRLGGGRIELFEPELGETALEALRLEAELRRALSSGSGLVLFFQPIVSLATGAVSSVEAFVRWEHPSLGLLLPQRFLPLAERTGILPAIERWVLHEACSQLALWQEPHRVTVNISSGALNDPSFVARVAQELRLSGLRPDQLALELSEHALLPEHSATRVAELRSLGVRVLLDDVGSGYAWLTRSQRLPVDGIKLGSAVVAELKTAEIASLAALIVDAARKLGLPVIAEGVETEEQIARVRELGIDAAQGLHFLAPVPASTLVDVLALSGPATPLAPPAPASPPGEERAVSLGEAAKLLGISASTLRRWAQDGRVTAVRTSGGHRRFFLSELSRLSPAGEPQLRTPALPDGPLPALAELLASDGVELASAAARSLYGERPGWFARAAALEPLRAFVGELSQAFERGSYQSLGDALRRLMLSATVGSATLAERHLFLERFSAALDARLSRAGRPAHEQTAARRTLSALALTQLADCAAPASTPRVPARRRRANRLREDDHIAA